ncbi:tyrosine-type recombinase/integrase [Terrihabitans rhizophilus]|uniref:Tyrosine-type recombinase/integrase n=1 Tax=Terrihabitans rhizophilus TaxID=3092662 RepID=A0ABU4RRE9_9HYPH|nr:tyrosine-type recombinase/integrase [Terrihabitans sp. PJ23]MDX6807425.1 tyrosine-type recombinase/integrase [Terrihabitans sp. PJ23]
MTVVRVKGIKRYREPKTGKWYCYHRASGTRILAEFGTAAFFVELDKLNQKHAPKAAKDGTLAALIKAYRSSPAFQDLARRTQSDYQKVLDYLAIIDDTVLAEIDGPFVAELRDATYQLRKRRFANYVIAVLSAMLSFGIERGIVKENAVKGVKKVKRPKDAPEANRPWTPEERDIVLAEAPPHLQVPIAIGRYTGLREGDVIRLGKTAYANGTITVRTSKTGQEVFWPCVEPLAVILEGMPQHDAITLCANSRGMPWTESGFRASFFKFLGKLHADGRVGAGLTFHGLRHTVAGELAELGWDRRAIADALGQSDERQAGHYSRRANLRKKMTAIVQSLDTERNGKKVV